MTRPKPTVLLQDVEADDRVLQVCEADALYAVCYCGEPIMIKTYPDINSNYCGPKYVKTSFPNAGHAFNLADKLNARFKTNEFTVAIMRVSRTIQER